MNGATSALAWLWWELVRFWEAAYLSIGGWNLWKAVVGAQFSLMAIWSWAQPSAVSLRHPPHSAPEVNRGGYCKPVSDWRASAHSASDHPGIGVPATGTYNVLASSPFKMSTTANPPNAYPSATSDRQSAIMAIFTVAPPYERSLSSFAMPVGNGG